MYVCMHVCQWVCKVYLVYEMDVFVCVCGLFWYCVWVAFKPDLKIKRPKGGKRGC